MKRELRRLVLVARSLWVSNAPWRTTLWFCWQLIIMAPEVFDALYEREQRIERWLP